MHRHNTIVRDSFALTHLLVEYFVLDILIIPKNIKGPRQKHNSTNSNQISFTILLQNICVWSVILNIHRYKVDTF